MEDGGGGGEVIGVSGARDGHGDKYITSKGDCGEVLIGCGGEGDGGSNDCGGEGDGGSNDCGGEGDGGSNDCGGEGDGGSIDCGGEGDGGSNDCGGEGSEENIGCVEEGGEEGVGRGGDIGQEMMRKVNPDDPPVVIDQQSSSQLSSSESMLVAGLSLYSRDRDILCSDTMCTWINDNIIYAAQLLLKEQSKGKIHGWQSTQCSNFKNLFPPVPPFSRFIQILHVGGNHWITVSNMKVPGDGIFLDSVCIYDSLCSTSISTSTKKQICSFLKPKSKPCGLML